MESGSEKLSTFTCQQRCLWRRDPKHIIMNGKYVSWCFMPSQPVRLYQGDIMNGVGYYSKQQQTHAKVWVVIKKKTIEKQPVIS